MFTDFNGTRIKVGEIEYYKRTFYDSNYTVIVLMSGNSIEVNLTTKQVDAIIKKFLCGKENSK